MSLQRLDHVLVLTDDLEATKAFYCDALGLEVGERPPLEFPGYWLTLGGVPCLHVAERQAYEAHAATLGLRVGDAVDHLAFTGAGYEQVAAAARSSRRGRGDEHRRPAPGSASSSSPTRTASEWN